MPNEPTADDFRRLLKRRGVKLNTLHAALRVPYLDERKRHYFRERDERIIKFISMIGGVRAPDLRRIVGLTQPTLGWERGSLGCPTRGTDRDGATDQGLPAALGDGGTHRPNGRAETAVAAFLPPGRANPTL